MYIWRACVNYRNEARQAFYVLVSNAVSLMWQRRSIYDRGQVFMAIPVHTFDSEACDRDHSELHL
jgi:hypothetical protein